MEEGKYRDGHGGGKQPLPWSLNSARVPGGKNIPGWDSTVQFLRLVGADTEIWACGSSQLSLRRQASRAGTIWSPWWEGKAQDVRIRTPEPSPSFPNSQFMPLQHISMWPPRSHPLLSKMWTQIPTATQSARLYQLGPRFPPRRCGYRQPEAGGREQQAPKSNPHDGLRLFGQRPRDLSQVQHHFLIHPQQHRVPKDLHFYLRKGGVKQNQKPLRPASTHFFRVSQLSWKEHAREESASILGSLRTCYPSTDSALEFPFEVIGVLCRVNQMTVVTECPSSDLILLPLLRPAQDTLPLRARWGLPCAISHHPAGVRRPL